jgi:hypothetical protein
MGTGKEYQEKTQMQSVSTFLNLFVVNIYDELAINTIIKIN